MPFRASFPTLDLHGHRRDEAIRKLTDFLERHGGGGGSTSATTDGPWVHVVTGTGSHSHAGPVLKTAVQKALDRRFMDYRQDRPGRFLVDAGSGRVLYNRQESAADTKVVVRGATPPEGGGVVGTSRSDGFCLSRNNSSSSSNSGRSRDSSRLRGDSTAGPPAVTVATAVVSALEAHERGRAAIAAEAAWAAWACDYYDDTALAATVPLEAVLGEGDCVSPPTPSPLPLPMLTHRAPPSTFAQQPEPPALYESGPPPSPPWQQARRRRRRRSSTLLNQHQQQNQTEEGSELSNADVASFRDHSPGPHFAPQRSGLEHSEERLLLHRVCSMSLLDLERGEERRSEAAAAETKEMEHAVRLSIEESQQQRLEAAAVTEREEFERVLSLSLEDRKRQEEQERLLRESEQEEIQRVLRMSEREVSAVQEERELLERVVALSRAEPQPEPLFDEDEQIQRVCWLSSELIETERYHSMRAKVPVLSAGDSESSPPEKEGWVVL